MDVVLHPELRDRMILLRRMELHLSVATDKMLTLLIERFELADCMMDLRKSVIIHGDDVLAHSNWEVGEQFIRKYRCVSFQSLRSVF